MFCSCVLPSRLKKVEAQYYTVGQNVKIGRRARPRKNAASAVFLAKLHNKTSESGSYK